MIERCNPDKYPGVDRSQIAFTDEWKAKVQAEAARKLAKEISGLGAIGEALDTHAANIGTSRKSILQRFSEEKTNPLANQR